MKLQIVKTLSTATRSFWRITEDLPSGHGTLYILTVSAILIAAILAFAPHYREDLDARKVQIFNEIAGTHYTTADANALPSVVVNRNFNSPQ